MSIYDKYMPHIASILMASNVGLFRRDIAARLPKNLDNLDHISQALNRMLNNNEVMKSGPPIMSGDNGPLGYRWAITPIGRSVYSVIHQINSKEDKGKNMSDRLQKIIEDIRDLVNDETPKIKDLESKIKLLASFETMSFLPDEAMKLLKDLRSELEVMNNG